MVIHVDAIAGYVREKLKTLFLHPWPPSLKRVDWIRWTLH
jgi:hypothetical protein